MAGLYGTRPRKAWSELGRIILASSAGIMVVIATVFFRREVTTSRFLVLAVWGLTIVFVWCGRLLLRTVRRQMLRNRIGHQYIAIIGQGKAAQDLKRLYQTRPTHGYTVVKQLKGWNDASREELENQYKKGRLDGVLLADATVTKDQSLDLIAFAANHNITFRYLADLFAASFTHVEVSTAEGIPIIEVKRTPLDGWGRIWKRVTDILISSILLILISPILLITGLALWVEDGWPVFFQNTRVGEGGREFQLSKLRSMWRKLSIGPQFQSNLKKNLALERELIKEKSIKEGPVYKIADDPRVTPIGTFIRRWSIDELPQFWNVLKGDMSLVGPRPHQPREVEKYLPHQRRVLAIKPGITGFAQISGRSDLDFEDESRLDVWYIENWSPALDLYILLKTPFAVLNKKGAY